MTTAHVNTGAFLLLMACAFLPAQDTVQEARQFDAAQLEQLVAPIALYPDTLLTHVLIAATYPIEVVEAERFVQANPGLTGDALQSALQGEAWDPGVKTLAGLPEVLKMMSENLEWTRDLGDAFLTQKAQLLDAVQRMRSRAREAGTLTSTPEQTVFAPEANTIAIESANPQVVYVPRYSPLVVYGGWSYPRYHYPRLFGRYNNYYAGYGSPLSFSVGFGWGSLFWGRPNWRFGHSDIWIDSHRWNRFNQSYGYNWSELHRVQGDRFQWRHRAEHRGGVRYPDAATARQFGVERDRRVVSSPSRGFAPSAIVPPTDRRSQREGVSPTNGAKLQDGSRSSSPSAIKRAPTPQRRVERAPQPLRRIERGSSPQWKDAPPTPRQQKVTPSPERSRQQQAAPRNEVRRPAASARGMQQKTSRSSHTFSAPRNSGPSRDARGSRSGGGGGGNDRGRKKGD